jgi:hypothetical protein
LERALKLFGPEGEEVAEAWRKLQNDKFNNFQYLPNIILMIISQTVKWAGHRRHEKRIQNVGRKTYAWMVA